MSEFFVVEGQIRTVCRPCYCYFENTFRKFISWL